MNDPRWLMVDVDDTLVRWEKDGEVMAGPNPYGGGSSGWKAHNALLDFITNWDGPVVIWSGGGADYARLWAERLMIRYNFACAKDPRKYPDGAVVIDDMDYVLDMPGTILVHPDEIKYEDSR